MKIFISSILLALAFSANAKNVTFKFNIYSSGPDIYPCNVGLKHEKHGDMVCRTVGDSTICTDDHGSMTSGDQLPDFFVVSYGEWDGWDYTPKKKNIKVRGNYTSNYKTLFGNGEITDINASYGKMIDKLSFNLASERYGADFFVDFCYRRSDFNFDGIKNIAFSAWAWASITDHVGGKYSYTALSDLVTSSEIYCTTGDNENKKFSYEGSTQVMTSSYQSTLNNVRIKGVPNRCVIRSYFSETNYDEERRYQKHGASVEVKAEISEPII